MNYLKKFIYKIFNINAYLVVPYILVIVGLMIYVFIIGSFNPFFDYIAYFISAYCLISICIYFFKNGKKQINFIFENNKYLKRFKEDPIIKTLFMLYKNLTLNGIYAIFKLVNGIIFKSIWFITFGIYYSLLIIVRSNLLLYSRNNNLGVNLKDESKKYKSTGILLLFFNLILFGMIALVVVKNQKIIYPGYTIYVMAIYTFYVVISGIINMFKYRRHLSPVMSAVQKINLSQALISMLSLEIAMLNQFGPEAADFNKTLIGITGFGVGIVFTVMSIYMIIKSNKIKESSN